MAYPGTKSPATRFPKDDDGDSKMEQSEGSKTELEKELQFGEAVDFGKGHAPTSRIYTRDYSKIGRSKGDTDLVTEALGKPLGL